MKEIYSTHAEGYPTYIVWEGEAYCASCANKFAEEENEDEDMTEDKRIFSRPEDAGIDQAINWEDESVCCSSMHGCGEQIGSAYGSEQYQGERQ